MWKLQHVNWKHVTFTSHSDRGKFLRVSTSRSLGILTRITGTYNHVDAVIYCDKLTSYAQYLDYITFILRKRTFWSWKCMTQWTRNSAEIYEPTIHSKFTVRSNTFGTCEMRRNCCHGFSGNIPEPLDRNCKREFNSGREWSRMKFSNARHMTSSITIFSYANEKLQISSFLSYNSVLLNKWTKSNCIFTTKDVGFSRKISNWQHGKADIFFANGKLFERARVGFDDKWSRDFEVCKNVKKAVA